MAGGRLLACWACAALLSLTRSAEASPRVSFWTEVSPADALRLARNASLLSSLASSRAAVRVAVRDLSKERAELVTALNDAGVEVSAWLLMPRDEGYWFNALNAAKANERYDDFLAWTRRFTLRFTAVGLDLEVDVRELNALLKGNFAELIDFVKRDEAANVSAAARAQLGSLASRISGDGFRVESYIVPFIVDERDVGSTALQRLTGLVDVPNVDVEIPMTYSSEWPDGEGLLASYAENFPQAIGVGSTGGVAGVGSVMGSFSELRRDALLAAQAAGEVHVYSLEGCLDHGWFDPLLSLDWSEVVVPRPSTRRWDEARAALRAALSFGCRINPSTCNRSNMQE